MTESAVASTTTAPAQRLVGVDAARGLALVGMFTAHLTNVEQVLDWSDPSTWWAVAAGRSSVLFAVLAGVSLALVTGRDRPLRGGALAVARRRIAARGILIALVGFALILLETPVAVILPTYGVLFVVLLPAVSWSRGALVGVAAVLAVVALPVSLASLPALARAGQTTQQVFLYYPVATFAAYLLVGLAVGRCDLGSRRTLARLAGGGAALALAAYAAGEAVTPGGAFYDGSGIVAPLDYVFASEPHSSTLVDILGSVGVALGVIGVCGLLAGALVPSRLLPAPGVPSAGSGGVGGVRGDAPTAAAVRRRGWTGVPLRLLAGIGAMPLTVYSAHLVVIAVLYHSGFLSTLSPLGEAGVLVGFVAGASALGIAWRGRRGPLERFVGSVAGRAGGREAV